MRHAHKRFDRPHGLALVVLACLAPALVVGVGRSDSAGAATVSQTRTDPSDATGGAQGKTDLRSLTWAVGAVSTTLTISVDESRYGIGNTLAELGVHVLVDTTGDGIADTEVVGKRAVDGVSMDMVLRSLNGTLSSAGCQDLGGGTVTQATVPTGIANSLETFSFTFDDSGVAGGLSQFRWVAFGQSPPDASSAGPWDYLPDQANPDAAASNPGDRRCNPGGTGLRIRQGAGIAFPDPATAVVLRMFDAHRVREGVVVRWRTSTELGIAGFNLFLERRGDARRLNRALILAGVQSTSGHDYTWLDRTAPARSGKLRYRLQAVKLDGTRRWIA